LVAGAYDFELDHLAHHREQDRDDDENEVTLHRQAAPFSGLPKGIFAHRHQGAGQQLVLAVVGAPLSCGTLLGTLSKNKSVPWSLALITGTSFRAVMAFGRILTSPFSPSNARSPRLGWNPKVPRFHLPVALVWRGKLPGTAAPAAGTESGGQNPGARST
jgi:hypothetical protein